MRASFPNRRCWRRIFKLQSVLFPWVSGFRWYWNPSPVGTTGVTYRTYEGTNPGASLSLNYRRDNRMPHLFNFLKIAQKITRTRARLKKGISRKSARHTVLPPLSNP